MKCQICKFAKCRWIDISDPSRIQTVRLAQVIQHNIGYIEMVSRDSQSSYAEERLYEALSPMQDELDRRAKQGEEPK